MLIILCKSLCRITLSRLSFPRNMFDHVKCGTSKVFDPLFRGHVENCSVNGVWVDHYVSTMDYAVWTMLCIACILFIDLFPLIIFPFFFDPANPCEWGLSLIHGAWFSICSNSSCLQVLNKRYNWLPYFF